MWVKNCHSRPKLRHMLINFHNYFTVFSNNLWQLSLKIHCKILGIFLSLGGRWVGLSHATMYTLSRKRRTKLMAVTLSNFNRFLKFFHWQILWEICIKDPTTYMLPHYFVKIFGTRNCHIHLISETIWHERLKLSCKIQPLKIHRKSKKQDTKLLSITSPNVNRFSLIFRWQTHC